MQKDDDLDDLLDEALNDFEREESRPPPPPPSVSSSSSSAVSSSSAPVDDMKKEIEETLDKMQLPPEMDEFRRALLSSFQSMASMAEAPSNSAETAAPGGEDDSAMMEAFLKDVLSKDVLYEPFREMRDKYPAWLAANRDKLPTDELSRFEKQSVLLVQICAAYESNANFDTIAILMEQVSTQHGKIFSFFFFLLFCSFFFFFVSLLFRFPLWDKRLLKC